MLPILFQDEHLVAVHKPAGLLVHRSELDHRDRRFLVQLLRDQLGARVFPIHRLDRATSGVMVLALSPHAARRMAAAFAGHRVQKTYLAVVRGYSPLEGRIDSPMRDARVRTRFGADDRPRAGVDDRGPERPALTVYRRLATVELAVAVDRYPTSRYSLLAVWPRTGRRHQIRRHLRRIAHPIVGDTQYGQGTHNRFFRSRLNCHRLLLAATAIEFEHPFSGRSLAICAPPAPAFARLADRMGWRAALATPAAPPKETADDA